MDFTNNHWRENYAPDIDFTPIPVLFWLYLKEPILTVQHSPAGVEYVKRLMHPPVKFELVNVAECASVWNGQRYRTNKDCHYGLVMSTPHDLSTTLQELLAKEPWSKPLIDQLEPFTHVVNVVGHDRGQAEYDVTHNLITEESLPILARIGYVLCELGQELPLYKDALQEAKKKRDMRNRVCRA